RRPTDEPTPAPLPVAEQLPAHCERECDQHEERRAREPQVVGGERKEGDGATGKGRGVRVRTDNGRRVQSDVVDDVHRGCGLDDLPWFEALHREYLGRPGSHCRVPSPSISNGPDKSTAPKDMESVCNGSIRISCGAEAEGSRRRNV